MSLRVWLPLNGTLDNQGLDNAVTTSTAAVFDNNGKIGKCLSYSTTDTNSKNIVYNVPNLATMLANGKKYSLACWIKIIGTTGNSFIVKLGTNTCGLWWGNNSPRLTWNENDNGKRSATAIASDYANWHHVVTVVDKSTSNIIKLTHYVDGVLSDVAGQTFDSTGMAQPTGTIITITPYKALLNDVRLYDHALSPMEVKQISQGLILHYPLNNNGFGQENLYGNGGDCIEDLSGLNNYGNKFSILIDEEGQTCAHVTGALNNTAYLQSKIPFTPKPNEEMTFSAWVKIKNIVRGTTNPMCGFYFSGQTIDGSWRGATKLKLTVDGIEYSVAPDAWDKAIKDTKWHKIICSAKFGNYEYTNNILPNIYLRDCTGDLYIHHIKYQRGTLATSWCPNKTDKISDKIGLNSSIEYDCSGYQKNGEKIGIDYSSDTPKYDVSSVFSASPSVIKIPNQNYAIQGSQNMTISVWAYKEDWSQYSQRIYSCTEGGGFNIQPISSGDISWSINVYTNAEKTSHKYASSNPDLYIRIPKTNFSSGWHMFTWVYTTKGTSLYIDGTLEKTMIGTSYGLYFNSTAPLILGGEATTKGYTSPYLNGKLSDFRIYCTALSSEDVILLYNNSAYIDNQGNVYGAMYKEV